MPNRTVALLPAVGASPDLVSGQASVARAEAAERAQEAITGELRATKAAAVQAHAKAARFRQVPELRGWAVRWPAKP